MDEFFGDFDSFADNTKDEVKQFISGKKTVWISLCNIYGYDARLPKNVDLEGYIKNQFPPGFEVARMDKPLRSPLCVTKKMKDMVSRTGNVSLLDLNDRFLYESKLPTNVAEGSTTDFGHSKLELIAQLLQKALATVKDNYALIVLNDKPNPANNMMRERVSKGDKCKEKLIVISALAALHSIGRSNTKVYTNCFANSIKEIIEWLSNPLSRQGDLLVSVDFVGGFEFTIIIDLTGGEPAVTTRTLANVIQIFSNPILDQQWAIENILKTGHDCSTIMDWTSARTPVASDITCLLGENKFSNYL